MNAAARPALTPRQTRFSAEEIFHGKGGPLDPLFYPSAVAVLGASEHSGSLGRQALSALLASPFSGHVFPIHSDQKTLLGANAYPDLTSLPAPADLALIATPVACVPQALRQCLEAGVKGAVIMSGGFAGQHGGQQIRECLRGSRMRVIGPNSMGLMNPVTGLNASLAQQLPLGGTVAFLSQSGALCNAILNWSLKQIVGFSAFVSVGSMLDVGWGDLIDHFGSDPSTQTIMIHMESICSARGFLSAAREVALNKPIIVIKAGRTQAALRAICWDGGWDVPDDDEVLEAAFRRVGVVRVENIADLFYVADALSKQPRPRGARLAVISNVRGPGIIAADNILAAEVELAELSAAGREKLQPLLQPRSPDENPAEVLGDGTPENFVKAAEIALCDDDCDGLLLLMVPQAWSDPDDAAQLLLTLEGAAGKPLLASFVGGTAAENTLTRFCIPTFAFPHTAARAFHYMWRYSYNLRGIYETPALRSDITDAVLRQLAASIIHSARDNGRTLLTETEAKRVLAAYQMPTLDLRLAKSEAEAVRIARETGFPVVLRLVPDAGLEQLELANVPLTLMDAESIARAWKLIASAVRLKAGPAHVFTVSVQRLAPPGGHYLRLGSRTDPHFGPVLLFGAGGRTAQICQERALGLPPLNATLARRMMEQTRIFAGLQSRENGKCVDIAALEAMLVRFSQLVVEQPWIREIDINPLLAAPGHIVALDARIVVYGPEMPADALPRPAIRPYPTQYVLSWTMKNGQTVAVRPIRPEDEPLLIKFHERLSDQSVYLRYFQKVKLSQRTSHDKLTRICFIDYDREMALVAERRDPVTHERRIIAVANLTKVHGGSDGEVAVIISDDCQGLGLGTEMLRRLVNVARDEGLKRAVASTMMENRTTAAMLKRLGFQVTLNLDEQVIEAQLEL